MLQEPADRFPPNAGAAGRSFGIYVHVPFCRTMCDYCAFAAWDDKAALVPAYLRACSTELRRAREEGLPASTTLYLGGGTPSILGSDQVAALMADVPVWQDAEVTMEANSDDITPAALAGWREAGVTRISLGVQSLVPTVVASLGRRQDQSRALAALDAVASAGFRSWSVDLMYGAAAESARDWERTLETVVSFGPPHVSAYGLTLEPGTPLWSDESRHPDADSQADRYRVADDVLGRSGLQWYEVSSWAAPGHRCRHNSGYWTGQPYRGFGCAAHSFSGERRWWNFRSPGRYIDAVVRGSSPVAAGEHLSEPQRRLERLMLGLRTREGVAASAAVPAELDRYVELRDGRAALTLDGRLVASDVTLRLAAAPGW